MLFRFLPIRGGHAPYPTDMPFGVSSGIPNVIIHAKFHVDRLRGFWAAGPPKVPFAILIGTTLTTVLHYRADCDRAGKLRHVLCTVVARAYSLEQQNAGRAHAMFCHASSLFYT